MNRIGERIKKRRELLKLHLNELAEKIGISSSALSQIEKSKSFPSVITLKNIAVHLHTTVGELIGENEGSAGSPVVLRNEMKFVDQNQSGTIIYQLSHNETNKQMDTYLVRFAKASDIETFFQNSQGQVFCYIIVGEIRFKIEEEIYLIKSGDSIYFNAKASKDIVNYHDGPSEMLWIQSPPSF